MVHAYADDGAGDISLLVAVDGDYLVVRVQDRGSGFPADGQDGVGLGLMRALADRVRIDSCAGWHAGRARSSRRLDEIPEWF